MTRLLTLAAIGAVVAVCAGSGLAKPTQPQAVLTQATGDLRVTNSNDGHAIFQASGLAPGGSVTGTVQLVNSGTLPGDLGLEQLDVQDQPGAGGGRLSSAIQLDITDITGGNSVPIFTGQLGGLDSKQLGSIGPRETRTFRFTASLPDGGLPPGPAAGDNAYAGSGLTVRYSWTATAAEPGPGGSGVTPPVVKIKVKSKKALKRGIVDVLTTCDIACRASAYAQLPKPKAKRGRKKKAKALRTRTRTATLTVPNKAARIRLKLSKKAKKQLVTTLKKKRRVVLKVKVNVSAVGGGPAKTYTRKGVVKRPEKKRRR